MSPSPRGPLDGLVVTSLRRGKAELVCRAGVLTAGLAHARTRVVTLAGSVVSDPSIGCSSFLKKILYYNNNNMNLSLVLCFCFSISFRDWGGRKEAEKCHSSVRS